jgi:uncharacterized protein (DUF2384 family)
MTTDNFDKFEGESARLAEVRLSQEDALTFLGVPHTRPLEERQLATLIAKGFSFEAMERLDQVLFPDGPQVWKTLKDPTSPQNPFDSIKLSRQESSRALHIAICWLLAVKVFKAEDRARYFMITRSDLLFGQSPIEWIRDGRGQKSYVIHFLESLAELDRIAPHIYQNED